MQFFFLECQKNLTFPRTFAMIKPDCYKNIGKIITAIEQSGFVISNIKMTKMELQDSQQFYAEHRVNERDLFLRLGKAILRGTDEIYCQ